MPRFLIAFLLSACVARSEPGMVLVPGGEFMMGVRKSAHIDEVPRHRVIVSAFLFDETLITVADFRAFVAATGWRTTAERVGTGLTSILGMKDWEWRTVRGLSWRAPWGEANALAIPLRDDMPAVMVSWHDADAYCRWAGKRLPTEAEWEYAMRAGAETRFPWGDAPRPGGAASSPRLNYWEGETHADNPGSDGWVYLSPVRAYPPNRWGLHDPVGNVWQWVADWYSEETFTRDATAHPHGARNPQGPASGIFKVTRGGSWWCSALTCHGYGLVARGKTRPEAPFSNNGFRCAKDV